MKRNLIFLLLLAATTAVTFFAIFGGADGISAAWSGAEPLAIAAAFAAAMVIATFVMGTATGDYSWVDRLWSVAPVLMVWYYCGRGLASGASGEGRAALVAATVLVTVWGVRLTSNFARRGGYSGEEDYRWSILRSRIRNHAAWHAFSLLFISFWQITLFVLFTLPSAALAAAAGTGTVVWAGVPIAVVLISAFFIVWETIADRQQWNFHALKVRVRAGGADAAEGHPWADDARSGFLRSGLFRYSRHPNYFGELGFWWSQYFLYAAVTREYLHWSILGPVMLTLLFIGSTIFTESITASKYPEYGAYRKSTSAIVPWLAASRKVPAATASREGR